MRWSLVRSFPSIEQNVLSQREQCWCYSGTGLCRALRGADPAAENRWGATLRDHSLLFAPMGK